MQIETTPAERRRHKVRERILTAAEKVFAKEGEQGLSIRRLAEEIDYSPAAIYKYFDSKEMLVDELKEAFFAKLMEDVHEVIDTSRPYDVRMRECVARYIELAVEKPHHYAAAFSGESASDRPGDGEPGFDDMEKGRAFAMLRGMVQEGIDLGRFRPELDAALAAKSIWAGMHGLAMMMLHIPHFPAFRPGQPGPTRHDFINQHADLLIRGLERH
jgi:AcrR family transcriptional regulator